MLKIILTGLIALLLIQSSYCQDSEEVKQLRGLLEAQEKRADQMTAAANKATKEAEQIRLINLAQALAEASLDVKENQLSALLALQAFNFNKQNYGYEYDRKIYNGLTSALLRFDSSQLNPISLSASVIATFSPATSNSILTVEANGRIRNWKNQDEKWQSEDLTARSGVTVVTAVINKEENVIALKIKSGKKNPQIEIYDLRDLKKAKAVIDVDSDVESIRLTSDGKGFYALTNSQKNIIYCNLIDTKTVVKSEDAIDKIDISSDGTSLAGISARGNLIIWDTQNYSLSKFQIENDCELTALTFAPKSKDLIIGNSSGQLKILTNGIVRRVLQSHRTTIDQIVFKHTGNFVASLDLDKRILIWNWNNLNQRPLEIHEKTNISNIAFLSNDELVTIAKFVHFWPLNMSSFASKLCDHIQRNMTKEEWEQYVGAMWDIPYQKTCPDVPANNR